MAYQGTRGARWTDAERFDPALAAFMGTQIQGGVPHPTLIPPSDWPKFLAMYEGQASIKDMAERFGVSTRTVRRMVARLWEALTPELAARMEQARFRKARRRSQRRTVLSERACHALALVRDGKTATEAGALAGLSAHRVRQVAHTAGVPLNRRKRVSKEEAAQALYEAVESTLPCLYQYVPAYELDAIVDALATVAQTRKRVA